MGRFSPEGDACSTMRFSLEGLPPTAHAPEIRDCFYNFRNANVVFFGAILVFGILDQFRFSRDVALFVAVPVVPILYLLCCAAYGRLARCFGQNSWSFSIAAFFLYPYEMILGYFAFNKGIRDAFEGDGKVNP